VQAAPSPGVAPVPTLVSGGGCTANSNSSGSFEASPGMKKGMGLTGCQVC
jgi:hypothetical protein